MSMPHGLLKNHETSRSTRRHWLGVALLWLLTLPGCTSEQLGTFSEVMRAMAENPKPVNSDAYPTIPQSTFQPNPSPWCIQITRIPSVGAYFQAKLQNTCNETMHVAYGYSTKLAGTTLQVPWCTPGHAGLRSGTTTLSPWESEGVAPLTHGHLDQVFWCACSDTNARAAFAEPVGLGVQNCRCRCASR